MYSGGILKMLKYYIVNILRKLFQISFFFFPIRKKRIFFSSFNGKNMSCNPKYIYKNLANLYPDAFEFIWVAEKNKKEKSVRFVKFNSFLYFYYYITSQVIIDNIFFRTFIPKRKNQTRIATWHGGGAYKKDGADYYDNYFERKIINLMSNDVDVFLSSCIKFTECVACSRKIAKDKFLACGMPRNDFLVNQPSVNIKESIKKTINLDTNSNIVLYAPTWRGYIENNCYNIDVEKILDTLEIKTKKKWIFLYRMHPLLGKHISYEKGIDMGNYPDMQELLYISDVLITDYSSCMWDFSLTYKPCFIYAVDAGKYKEDRDFYTPMSQWPFPIAQNSQELAEKILCFNDIMYRKNIVKHHEALGSYERGVACDIVCEKIYNICCKNI